jgi:tRNA(Leu) C34 or U34 (ribose-2'-O)-methylase TrmL
MNTNQYFGVGLYHAKNHINVGNVLRAAGCFGASFVATQGSRFRKACTDTFSAWKSIPLFEVEDFRHVVPYDAVPVAVDLVEGAERLETYVHPRRAFYIFGGEDQTLGKPVLEWCRDVVVIPAGCLNLAAAVNIVMYDRVSKALRGDASLPAPGANHRRLKAV